MEVRVGINGFGRIGKNLWHLLLDNPYIKVVAVNHPNITVEQFIYMARNDTLLFYRDINLEVGDGFVVCDGRKVFLYGESKPEDIPWEEVDVVVDCSGVFKTVEKLRGHKKNGVQLVILSAPATDNMEVVINGLNDGLNDWRDVGIISCGSCTTNCLLPILEIFDSYYEIEFCNFLTVHATTASQTVSDRKNLKDFRLGRNAYQNIIPTSTGASGAIRRFLPHLDGKVFGSSCRVPVENGSYLEVNLELKRDINKEEIFELLKERVELSDNYNVSSDIKKVDKICVVDKDLVKIYDKRRVKIGAWYNNEGGYVRQIIEVIRKTFI